MYIYRDPRYEFCILYNNYDIRRTRAYAYLVYNTNILYNVKIRSYYEKLISARADAVAAITSTRPGARYKFII